MRDAGYRGAVVACDSSLGYCLRNGLVPEYMVTVDSHPHRMIRWLGDPHLASRPADDYFVRQDLDPIHQDEVAANETLLRLVNEHGPSIKAIIATSVDPQITQRCLDVGMTLYWWNPLYDDYDVENSLSREVFELNGVPCMVTGGNCGTAAWVFAHSILGKQRVALLGMDLGYPPGTPLERTQYYVEMREIFGDRMSELYIPVTHPTTGETWYADPTYHWYRQVFLELVAQAPCETVNCSEGGTVFGEGVRLLRFADFLAGDAG
jgi:hypothetical protein